MLANLKRSSILKRIWRRLHTPSMDDFPASKPPPLTDQPFQSTFERWFYCVVIVAVEDTTQYQTVNDRAKRRDLLTRYRR